MKQYLKDFIHNVIVHPLMMLMPPKTATEFHDWNARWAFKEYLDELEQEGIKQRGINKFDQELLLLQWNRADSHLEPPGTRVYVMTSDLTIHKAYRKGYSTSYNGMDYYDAHTGEKVGRVLYWAYC